ADCVAGEEHCRCTGGACGPGLRCSAGTVCVDRSGYTQGACLDGERCHFGNRCQEGVCVLCSQGSQGCDCRDNNTCNTGLACDDTGHCVDPRGLAQTNPDPRICTTPCSEGLTLADGRYLSCPANGLVQGCFGETTCVEGQCLKGGATARTCTTELECPDFQTCLAGACTSNCATADDCVVGSTCFRQVCRQTCAVDDEASVCGSDHHCHLVDGQSGVCKRNVPATGDSRNTPIDTFSVSTDAVDLNGISATATLVLTNHSPEPTLFTITKRSSVVVDSNNRTTTLELEPGGQCVSSACPLWWLELHEPQQGPWLDPVQTLVVEAGEETTLTLSHNTHHPRWEGSLEIRASNGGLRHVSVRHTNQPTGQWSGKVYTFGHFKDVGLAPWMDDRANPALTEQMENAFVRLWANFRQGRLSFEQFQAGLTSTRTESWRSQRLYALGCQEGSICFPYSNFEGFLTYTTDPINVPVPSGVVEMPMAMNLTTGGGGVDAACQGSDYCFVGRIESSNALQYAGNPKVVVKLASDPRSCSLQDASSGCLTFLDAMEATVAVGGRYQTDAQDATCSRAPTVLGEGSTTSSSPLELELVEEPWLVTGYHGRSELDSDTGRRTTHTCRDLRAPLPGANPMPDGRVRLRQLELIDGALINNNIMVIIFRERMDSILTDRPEDAIEGYGVMVLRRSEAELGPEDYEGHTAEVAPMNDRWLRPIACDEALLADLNLTRRQLERDPNLAELVVQSILEGVTVDVNALHTLEADYEGVHYLCVDTGMFDGGPRDDRVDGSTERVPCPVGSRVRFFALELSGDQRPLLAQCGGLSVQDCHQAWMANLECQREGTCAQQLEAWLTNGSYGIRPDPYYRCEEADRVYCNDDRLDLRNGKQFYSPNSLVTVAQPIRTEVAEAFRYRTRFVNRSGANVGFVPEICIQGTELVPYCYDPEAIERIRGRVECAMELYTDFYGDLSEAKQVALWEYLDENFSYVEEVNIFNEVQVRRGFEFLDME
ncbi:MAG: hypothetical protein AAFX99_24435, partial [Myxococcota bacterium]